MEFFSKPSNLLVLNQGTNSGFKNQEGSQSDNDIISGVIGGSESPSFHTRAQFLGNSPTSGKANHGDTIEENLFN
jgi:hypothetical protein